MSGERELSPQHDYRGGKDPFGFDNVMHLKAVLREPTRKTPEQSGVGPADMGFVIYEDATETRHVPPTGGSRSRSKLNVLPRAALGELDAAAVVERAHMLKAGKQRRPKGASGASRRNRENVAPNLWSEEYIKRRRQETAEAERFVLEEEIVDVSPPASPSRR